MILTKDMRFRQIHLDFHTSEHIKGVGSQFDKKEFQKILLEANINSITCFSSCHHGWSYHPTEVGKMHPNLDFDLFGEQIKACKEVDINVPAYLTAGVNNLAAQEHPEWREVGYNGEYLGWTPSVLIPGFKNVCFNSPYLVYLCNQIRETLHRYPNCDGIFLDIITQSQCCCKYCMELMDKEGLDVSKERDRIECSDMALLRYYKMTTKTVKDFDPTMPIFHNSGHISKDKPEVLEYFSHLEMESLPTGGWGYDHFPMSVKYSMNGKHEYLGMTGKFNTTWGEFGGFKHPNALLYETSAMLAFNARCSIGDQLHPSGKLDASTYEMIGKAYGEVAKKEQWCVNTENVADIALVNQEAVNKLRLSHEDDSATDTGAARILLEGHYLFDTIDDAMEIDKYKLVILPDNIKIKPAFKKKLDNYLSMGGKIILTGSTVFDCDSKAMFDIGADYFGESCFCPDYIGIADVVSPDFVKTPLVMYMASKRIKVTSGRSLGKVYDSYFNREAKSFSSHQHTPYSTEDSGFDCGVIKGNILYLAHPIFSIYRWYGAVAYKQYICNCIDMLLGDNKSLITNLPSTARISFMWQPENRRFVLHLLYSEKACRGGDASFLGSSIKPTSQIEVIENLTPLVDICLEIRSEKTIKKAILQPQGQEIEIVKDGDVLKLRFDSFVCHAMIELQY